MCTCTYKCTDTDTRIWRPMCSGANPNITSSLGKYGIAVHMRTPTWICICITWNRNKQWVAWFKRRSSKDCMLQSKNAWSFSQECTYALPSIGRGNGQPGSRDAAMKIVRCSQKMHGLCHMTIHMHYLEQGEAACSLAVGSPHSNAGASEELPTRLHPVDKVVSSLHTLCHARQA